MLSCSSLTRMSAGGAVADPTAGLPLQARGRWNQGCLMSRPIASELGSLHYRPRLLENTRAWPMAKKFPLPSRTSAVADGLRGLIAFWTSHSGAVARSTPHPLEVLLDDSRNLLLIDGTEGR